MSWVIESELSEDLENMTELYELTDTLLDVEKTKNKELTKRAHDRDALELELRACYKKDPRAELEDLKHTLDAMEWQMSMVVKTCPGRARPPRRPQ